MNSPGQQNPPTRGLLYRRLIAALMFSIAGLRRALKEEACRVELFLLPPLVALGIWLGQTPTERILLIAPLFAVFIVELLNTAIEVTINRISTEHHLLSGEAKDLGSAAVFVTMMLAALCWIIVLWR